MPTMKATTDIPDELYRRVEARSAPRGKAIREVTIGFYDPRVRPSGTCPRTVAAAGSAGDARD